MRLFGGERVSTIMDSLGVEEDMPIENKMISGTIENAQKKLEARNFSIRKNVLQFDDVMNSQREIIYGQRDKVLQRRGRIRKCSQHDPGVHRGQCPAVPGGRSCRRLGFRRPAQTTTCGWLAEDGDFNYTPEELWAS